MPLFTSRNSGHIETKRRHPEDTMTMHVVVEQPLTDRHTGSITCRPMGIEPFQFTWSGPNVSELVHDESKSCASNASVGSYTIDALDATNRRAIVAFDMLPLQTSPLIVTGYEVTSHASSGVARDGSLRAVGSNLDSWFRFLWSNGVETSTPVLHDVGCGRYAVIAIADGDKGIPLFIHDAEPAMVHAKNEVRYT